MHAECVSIQRFISNNLNIEIKLKWPTGVLWKVGNFPFLEKFTEILLYFMNNLLVIYEFYKYGSRLFPVVSLAENLENT